MDLLTFQGYCTLVPITVYISIPSFDRETSFGGNNYFSRENHVARTAYGETTNLQCSSRNNEMSLDAERSAAHRHESA